MLGGRLGSAARRACTRGAAATVVAGTVAGLVLAFSGGAAAVAENVKGVVVENTDDDPVPVVSVTGSEAFAKMRQISRVPGDIETFETLLTVPDGKRFVAKQVTASGGLFEQAFTVALVIPPQGVTGDPNSPRVNIPMQQGGVLTRTQDGTVFLYEGNELLDFSVPAGEDVRVRFFGTREGNVNVTLIGELVDE